MAVLSDADRADVTTQCMQQMAGPHTILKADIRAAVNALDDWLNTNAPSANQALPQPARSAMSLADKALMNTLIVDKRYRTGA
jgi:hypothetical protein